MLKGKKEQKTDNRLYLFKGLIDATPVAVNPDDKKIKELGLGNKAPSYTRTRDNGDEFGLLYIYHKWNYNNTVEGKVDNSNVEFSLPLKIYITEKEIYSERTGKYLFTNNKGDFKWAISLEDIAAENELVPANEPYKLFNVDKKYAPRVAYEGEILLTNYLIALSGFDKKAESFEIDVREYWPSLLKGDGSKLEQDILQFDKVRMLVMIDEGRQAMQIFDKESKIGESPFLRAGELPYEGSKFMKLLFDLQKDAQGNFKPGEYSLGNRYDISFNPELVEVSMPDISKFMNTVEEEDNGVVDALSESSESDMPF